MARPGYFFRYMLLPGIEPTAAESHLLEVPLKDTLPTELHGHGEALKLIQHSQWFEELTSAKILCRTLLGLMTMGGGS